MMKNNILFAEDESTFREIFSSILTEEGYSVTSVSNGLDALEAIQKQSYSLAILDIHMPGADGIKVLREIKIIHPKTRVIVITAYGSVERAIETIKLGASDYVVKPVIFQDILSKIQQQLQIRELENENLNLKCNLQKEFGLGNIIGKSSIMQAVYQTIQKVAQTKSNVLIIGESGTGKELAARAVHSSGISRKGLFVGVNCSAVPEPLFESELFGHKKGSFTTALYDKEGLFQAANGGTLFLDEVGNMPLNCQAKLLRAIEQKQIIPVGATEPIDYDLHLITAMNKDPEVEIKAGRFREDHYYSLKGGCI
jgi:two-component system response regulator PilR (NtrC family)